MPFLLSEKAVEEIRRAGLTGITCFEKIENVRFQRRSKTETAVPGYYHIELARSRITINHPESVISYGKNSHYVRCPLCRQVPAPYDFFRSLSFNTGEYEGYDIFQIYELGNTVFLSQRFVDFYRESSLTNLCFGTARKHGAWAASYFLDGNEDA